MTNADMQPNIHNSQLSKKINNSRYQAPDDHAMQLDQDVGEAGPTATPFMYSRSMHTDLDAETPTYPQKRPGFFASLVCCCCSCTVTSNVDPEHQFSGSGRHAVTPSYAVSSSRPVVMSGTPISITSSSSASDPTQSKQSLQISSDAQTGAVQQIVPRRSSGVPVLLRRTIGTTHSEGLTEFGDATSYFSGDLDNHVDDIDGLDDITNQLQVGLHCVLHNVALVCRCRQHKTSYMSSGLHIALLSS